ncbi:class II aldolase/adducin family protein [Polynucleobacter nymphae]|jgi:3-hydroxy-2-methylpyridine-4,5-dicarboxylate 4-decarboxylase|uniref:class II aldolase/adducin family protein n=1 Tax=Polynucleobacter nymphae TaxID=2081043 RepID=UPI001C0DBC26|nr:class II aldolase/adducin family protein [Polynucleobacter nymphae]MBU3607403.1 class II aldolase/adducin family protein [Polynucleobacter nymphae]
MKRLFMVVIFIVAIQAHAASVQEQMEQNPAVKLAVEELVIANHILYDQNAVDGYGHISVRNPANPNTFFLARSVAPSVVKVEDIMEFDMDGKALNGDTRVAYGERFIHSGILKNRPDINSVIHGHASPILSYGLTGVTLKPVYHMSAFLGEGAPIFEIRNFAKPNPDTDMFISNSDLGDALSQTMGLQYFVLMRGHGYAAGADSIKKAVFRTVYAIQNASIQAEAMKMGQVQYLTPGEAATSKETIEKTIGRPWQLWTERVKKSQ